MIFPSVVEISTQAADTDKLPRDGEIGWYSFVGVTCVTNELVGERCFLLHVTSK